MTARLAADIHIDLCDITTQDEVDEIRDLIEAAIGHYRPTITVSTREYDTSH